MHCRTILAAALILVGSLFALTASVGLLRLPDLYTRMHAASKAGTLGSCVMLLALAVHADDPAIALRALGRRGVLPADRADFLASAGQGRAWRRLSIVGWFRARRPENCSGTGKPRLRRRAGTDLT